MKGSMFKPAEGRMNLESNYKHPEIHNNPQPYLGLKSLQNEHIDSRDIEATRRAREEAKLIAEANDDIALINMMKMDNSLSELLAGIDPL